ncbi:MAG: MarR family transcriptional regulator [Rhizobiaceae bacterium]
MMDKSEFAKCLDCMCLAARKRAQEMTRFYDDRLRAHGLTINQFSMLTTLILAGALPIASLAERLGIDRTTMSRNLALGEAAGWVTVAAGDDRRVRMVAITKDGRHRAEAALPAWREAQMHFADH